MEGIAVLLEPLRFDKFIDVGEHFRLGHAKEWVAQLGSRLVLRPALDMLGSCVGDGRVRRLGIKLLLRHLPSSRGFSRGLPVPVQKCDGLDGACQRLLLGNTISGDEITVGCQANLGSAET